MRSIFGFHVTFAVDAITDMRRRPRKWPQADLPNAGRGRRDCGDNRAGLAKSRA